MCVDGWMDRWVDRWMDACMIGWIDGWISRWMDGLPVSHQISLGMSASNMVKQVSIFLPLQDFVGAVLGYAP